MLILSALIYVYIFIPHVFIFSALIYVYTFNTHIFSALICLHFQHSYEEETDDEEPRPQGMVEGAQVDFFFKFSSFSSFFSSLLFCLWSAGMCGAI